MAASRLIKRRIKSAKNISQITKAMEMVSASKMRRAQSQALASRPYAEKLSEMLRIASQYTSQSAHPLLKQNDSPKTLLVLISSDRGLTGGLNTNLFRAALEFSKDKNVTLITVGKKAREFAVKTGLTILGEFNNLPEKISFEDALPIAQLAMQSFLTGEFGQVHLMHMRFITTLSQKVEMQQVLPLVSELIEQPAELISAKSDYVFEPSPSEVLDFLLPYYIELEVYQTMLDAKASEHSARMVAMKNASDNAKDVVSELQLIYNKSRQAGITRELNEITTAALSVAG
ncbi:MAG TPA: ATP synthase F1 subunit gamma [Candidatus Saccharimonadia bacterium]|nr:ATP synthase F1 subunit gamma [Candidatus Saccharimonadia bacterium]